MSLLVDPCSNKLLLIWQQPCLLDITDLLEVRYGVLVLELLEALLVYLSRWRAKD